MTILQAGLAQLEQVAVLFNAYREFYEQPSDLPGALSFIAGRMRNKESVIFLASTSKGLPAGFIQLYPCFTSVGMRRMWILNDLFITDDSRKQGYAEALMNAAKDFARADGAKRLMLQTGIDNFFAQQLYEKMGYVRDTHSYYYELEL